MALGQISRRFRRKLKAECLVDDKIKPPLRFPYDKEIVFRNLTFSDRPEGLYPKIACKITDKILQCNYFPEKIYKLREPNHESMYAC